MSSSSSLFLFSFFFTVSFSFSFLHQLGPSKEWVNAKDVSRWLDDGLVRFASKFGDYIEEDFIFNRMPERDGVSWNSLISGYASRGLVSNAVKGYNSMLTFSLNRITFSTMLILSSSQGCIDLGRQIHGQILKFGFGSYVFVGCPLVDLYSKAGLVYDAKRVFDEAPERNVVMYNTMITGLLRCGMVEDSWRLFHSMLEKDLISWTTMITGLTQNVLYREAIDLFREMRIEN